MRLAGAKPDQQRKTGRSHSVLLAGRQRPQKPAARRTTRQMTAAPANLPVV